MSHRHTPLARTLAATLIAVASFAAQAADLTVSAAASLTNAFRELGPIYEAQHPGTKVVFNFASSDALLAQISNGAPVDVFASADQDAMDKAQAQKLLADGSRRDFVSNSLVFIAPADSAIGLKTLDDVQRPEVKRVAIGNPANVPVGRYTQGALEAAKLWGVVQPKAVMALNVRQALDYVSRGEAEAGFVYATDAAIAKDKVKVVTTVTTVKAVTYPIARIATGPNGADGARFLAFIMTPQAQAVLARYGFGKP